jgi:hypothetical protein
MCIAILFQPNGLPSLMKTLNFLILISHYCNAKTQEEMERMSTLSSTGNYDCLDKSDAANLKFYSYGGSNSLKKLVFGVNNLQWEI